MATENSTNTVSYGAATAQNLLLDSGCLYTNYGIVGKEAPICATSGGNEFDVTVKTRDVVVDGLKGVQKGLRFVTSVSVTLKANLLEFTSTTLQLALNGVVDTTGLTYDSVTGKTTIDDTDYLENIALVGKLSGSDTPVIIILSNVLASDGIAWKSDDDKDNVLPVTFTAFADPTTPTVLPYEIRFPKAVVVS
jgi:hypothetical protein